MGGNDHRRTVHHGHVGEQVDDLGTRRRIEVARGLVCKDDARFHRQRARYRDALLLATGQVGRKMARALERPTSPSSASARSRSSGS